MYCLSRRLIKSKTKQHEKLEENNTHLIKKKNPSCTYYSHFFKVWSFYYISQTHRGHILIREKPARPMCNQTMIYLSLLTLVSQTSNRFYRHLVQKDHMTYNIHSSTFWHLYSQNKTLTSRMWLQEQSYYPDRAFQVIISSASEKASRPK